MTETTKDKFQALWISHSKIGDFLKCPRLYYLHNVYKDLRTNHKITIITPPLALGQAVHETVEAIADLPSDERLKIPPDNFFEKAWKKVVGEKGGFEDYDQELSYKKRGYQMLKRVEENPGPVANKAIRIRSDNGLLYYWFSDEENIILSGKIDWIEYLPKSNAVHIIDFKSGRLEEDEKSLQLPIYFLLAKNLQKRSVEKVSYWYLNNEKGLVQQKLPDEKEAIDRIGKIASRISLAKKLNHFKCPTNGCKYCYPYERILKNDGKWVGTSEYSQDIYILKKLHPETD